MIGIAFAAIVAAIIVGAAFIANALTAIGEILLAFAAIVAAIIIGAAFIANALSAIGEAVMVASSGIGEAVKEASSALSEATEAFKGACSRGDPLDESEEPTALDVLHGNLSTIGYKLDAIETALIKGFSGAERRRQAALRQAALHQAALRQQHPDWILPVTTAAELQPGNLVVHTQHGIGRYRGLSRSDDRDTDVLWLEYADGELVFLPVERLDLISKYVGSEPMGLDPLYK